MMITMHPQHRQSGHADDHDGDDNDDPSSVCISSITSSYHDNHRYASSAFLVVQRHT